MAMDRGRIVDEALLLLNEVGIDKLTTRRLAERLGVQQPALYWHFANKSALLDAVNSAMLARYHKHRLPAPGARTWPTCADRAAALLQLAVQAWHRGDRQPADQALPLYLRDKVAQTTAERQALRRATGSATGSVASSTASSVGGSVGGSSGGSSGDPATTASPTRATAPSANSPGAPGVLRT